MSDIEEDVVEVVDEIADDVEPARVEREAIRLGISPDELIDRVAHEVKARLREAIRLGISPDGVANEVKARLEP